MYSFYAILFNNNKAIINIYLELDFPYATRKSGVGLPIYLALYSIVWKANHKFSYIFLIFFRLSRTPYAIDTMHR